jgi:hypothetical protein
MLFFSIVPHPFRLYGALESLTDAICKDLEHLFPNRIVVRIVESSAHDIPQILSRDLRHDDHKEVPAGAWIAIVLCEFGVGDIGRRVSRALTFLECKAFIPKGQNPHFDGTFLVI